MTNPIGPARKISTKLNKIKEGVRHRWERHNVTEVLL